MITKDQPSIFGQNVVAAVSFVQDGNMKKRGFSEPEQNMVHENRKHFLEPLGIELTHTVLVSMSYDTDNFTRYKTVTDHHAGDGITRGIGYDADGLATQSKHVALFLPIADCVGAILYDPTTDTLMVSHLGRHSVEQDGGQKSVEFMSEQFGVKPEDLLVWLSPSPSKESYPMYAFENRGLQEVVMHQFSAAGVSLKHIEANPIDTSTSLDYFSHSEYKKGNRDQDGRFAIVAMLK